ncbi:hypothetical protein [Bradyrhizobium sp. S3.2.12]|uniref:hypothetical protein n=1 Tax=Bradyrhizobium sp. S3.2.12 TaxID=3156387 RepID=UPI003393D48F
MVDNRSFPASPHNLPEDSQSERIQNKGATHCIAGIYRRLESIMMIRVQKSRAAANAWRAEVGRESSVGDIQACIAELRSLPREELADAVFMLSMNARRQGELIRQAIEKRAEVDLDFDPPANADVATYLANDAVSTLRHHVVDLPDLLDFLVQQAPDVCFTVHREEAVLLLAAIIREQRLEGVLEGLRLAGLLNEPAKDRHAGIGSDADLRGAADGV